VPNKQKNAGNCGQEMSVVNALDHNDRSIDNASIDRDTFFTVRLKLGGIQSCCKYEIILFPKLHSAFAATKFHSFVMYIQALYIRYRFRSHILKEYILRIVGAQWRSG